MQRIMCKSKVQGLTITHKNLLCEGSIELPEEILNASDILPGEIVLVINEYNGERFNTYAIKSEEGRCGLLGGAARLGEVGDKLLVLSYAIMDTESAKLHGTKIIRVGSKNKLLAKGQ